MFKFLKSNNPKVGDRFKLKYEGDDIIIDVIAIDKLGDKTAISIKGWNDTKQEDHFGHFPIDLEALKKSDLEPIEKASSTNYDMEGYNIWKRAVREKGAGVFTITISEILDAIPKPSLTFMRLDNAEVPDFRLLRHKGITVFGIFDQNGELGSFAPAFSDVELPRMPLNMNQLDFHKLEQVTIQGQEIEIGYYDYSKLIKNKFDLQMIGYRSENIDSELYETIRRLRLIDLKSIANLDASTPQGLNDVSVSFNKNNNVWDFEFAYKDPTKPLATLSKEEGDQLISAFKAALDKFSQLIKEKDANKD